MVVKTAHETSHEIAKISFLVACRVLTILSLYAHTINLMNRGMKLLNINLVLQQTFYNFDPIFC